MSQFPGNSRAARIGRVAARQQRRDQSDDNVQRIRDMLRAAGYNVRKRGPMTQRLQSAFHDFRAFKAKHGFQTAEMASKWNKANVLDRNPAAYTGMENVRNKAGQKAVQKKYGVPDPKVKAHQQAVTKVKARVHSRNLGAQGHGSGGGSSVPGLGGDMSIPSSTADSIAGLQYDPAIREAKLQQLRQQRDEAQAQHNISHWGDIVSASQDTARQRDTATNTRVSGDVQGAIQGIQNLLGGSRGAGVVGAAGANDLTAIDQAGAAQDQFNADLAPILRAQQSDQSARERASGSQAAEKLASQLLDLQGQRGQAKAKAAMDIKQQNFTNRLAIQNAVLAAESMGLKKSEVNAQLAQYGLNNKVTMAKLAQQRAAARAASGHPNWATLNPIDRQTLIDNAIKTAAGQNPHGHWDPTAVLNSALATIRAGGYGSARKLGFKGRIPSRANQQSILGLLNQRMQYYHGQNPGQ